MRLGRETSPYVPRQPAPLPPEQQTQAEQDFDAGFKPVEVTLAPFFPSDGGDGDGGGGAGDSGDGGGDAGGDSGDGAGGAGDAGASATGGGGTGGDSGGTGSAAW